MLATEPRPNPKRRHSDTALAIRSYFGLRFVEWSKRHRVTLGGIVTLDSGQLMAAVMNLCNYMRADGKLLDARGQPRGIDGERPPRDGDADLQGPRGRGLHAVPGGA